MRRIAVAAATAVALGRAGPRQSRSQPPGKQQANPRLRATLHDSNQTNHAIVAEKAYY
jgi:hypothetical protein